MVVPIQWDEPFGIVFAEALACGTPVISCPRGSLPEIVRPGVDGFLIKSIEEGCEAVGKLGTHRPRRLPAPRRARNTPPEVVVSRYLDLYERAWCGAGGATMRRVALVSGHFAPSNLVGAHRARLWSRYLPEFGWEPIVVTGDPAHYEERPDPDLERLVAPGAAGDSCADPADPADPPGRRHRRARLLGLLSRAGRSRGQARDRFRAGDHPVEFPGAGRPADPSPLRRAVRHRLPGSVGESLARRRGAAEPRLGLLPSGDDPRAMVGARRGADHRHGAGLCRGHARAQPGGGREGRDRLHADGHRAGGLRTGARRSIARRSCSSRATATST